MKIKIIQKEGRNSYNYYGEEENKWVFYPLTEDWEEVSEKEYYDLVNACSFANSLRKNDKSYIIISYSEEIKQEFFKKAKDFKDYLKKEEEKRKKAEEERIRKYKEKQEAKKLKTLEQKKSLLEKLKKELNEE